MDLFFLISILCNDLSQNKIQMKGQDDWTWKYFLHNTFQNIDY